MGLETDYKLHFIKLKQKKLFLKEENLSIWVDVVKGEHYHFDTKYILCEDSGGGFSSISPKLQCAIIKY